MEQISIVWFQRPAKKITEAGSGTHSVSFQDVIKVALSVRTMVLRSFARFSTLRSGYGETYFEHFT